MSERAITVPAEYIVCDLLFFKWRSKFWDLN